MAKMNNIKALVSRAKGGKAAVKKSLAMKIAAISAAGVIAVSAGIVLLKKQFGDERRAYSAWELSMFATRESFAASVGLCILPTLQAVRAPCCAQDLIAGMMMKAAMRTLTNLCLRIFTTAFSMCWITEIHSMDQGYLSAI